MKPLFHPAIEDVTVEGILHALSDPTRVAIYAAIATSACEHTCSSLSNVVDRPIPKSTTFERLEQVCSHAEVAMAA